MNLNTQKTHSYQNLWLATRGQRVRYANSVVFATLSNIFLMGAPLISKYAIDVITEEDFAVGHSWVLAISSWFSSEPSYVGYLLISAAIGVFATACTGICQFIRDRLSAVASEQICLQIREALFSRLHHAPNQFFDESETGDLVQRCSSDIETVRVFMHADVDEFGRAILFLGCMIPILLYFNPQLTLVSLSLMPFLIGSLMYFFYRIKDLFLITDEAEAALTTVIQENLTGIRVVQAFARQDYEQARFDKENANFREHYYKLNRTMAFFWAGGDVISLIQVALVLVVGSYFVMLDQLTIGSLFMFFTLVSIVVWRLRHLGRLVFDAGKAVVSLKRIRHILNTEEESVEEEPEKETVRGKIEFKNVTLSYGTDDRALDGINLAIEPGEFIGIVGSPGSGKSTLIRALLRLYPIDSGLISLDGQDITEVNRKWLRKRIGVVLQDPFLYSRTIEENLLVADPTAIEGRLVQATTDAAIHNAIMEFPDRYQSLIGERGVTLSGGQRQRLAIARALLKRPSVLVLDDSLSAVDTSTERYILNALNQYRSRHTVIVIAHRLTSVMHADRILYMERGKIVQMGSHDELSTVPGPYRHLCELQETDRESVLISA